MNLLSRLGYKEQERWGSFPSTSITKQTENVKNMRTERIEFYFS